MSEKPSNKRAALSLGPTSHEAVAKRPNVQAAVRTRALAELKSTYGYDAFRGKQEEAVLAALAGRDVLVIMPTGGGKTICYVIPALVQPGVCIVVSPLLALMQDQVANLTKVGVRAAQLSSALPAAQRSAILADLASGGGGGRAGAGQPSIRLLLVTPELLAASDRFRAVLRRLHTQRNLSLFAIDESHCISTWGHDFRPAYRKLRALRRDYPGVPIMALTATAAAKVQDDICNQLCLNNPVRLLSSFNRPNISYTVRYLDVEEMDEVNALVELLSEKKCAAGDGGRGGAGAVPCSIVYCQKRETCEAVAGRLKKAGLPAAAYHGRMPKESKQEVLRRWQADEIPVVVATIAFGMGIDKAGVRLVVHYNLPRSLEGFYQEAGRAGRDGQPAESVVFYRWQARRKMDFILRKDQEKRAAQRQRGGAGVGEGDYDSDEEGCGGGGGTSGTPLADGEDVTAAAAADMVATAEEKAQIETTAWQAFGQVVDWAVEPGCRRRALLAHFGEEMLPRGGRCAGTGDGHGAGCDYCRSPKDVAAQLEALRKKELAATVQRGGCGKGNDEEADMFAVRGGGGGGGGDGRGDGRGGDDAEAGPSIHHAGRRSPPECRAELVEARSAAAAARAAAGGQVNDKYFAALAAQEKEHERRQRESAGDVVDRMLAGGGGGGGSGSAPPAPPPDAATRANASAKLAAALAASQAGAELDPALVRRLAAVVEADVYGSGLPRQQYTSRMAGLLSRTKATASVLKLLPQSGPTPSAGTQTLAAPVAELLPSLLQAEVAAIESLLLDTARPNSNTAAAVSSGAAAPTGKAGSGAVSQIVARLGALASVAVTVGAVAAGGVGRRVAKLKRHANLEVAEAAGRVVESWKQQLPEHQAPPPPPKQQQQQQIQAAG